MANLSLRRTEQPTTPARQQQSMPALLSAWDPFRMMERLLGEPFLEMAGGRQVQPFFPAFDVQETNDRYIFKADLPGVKESDIQISLTGNQLTISGKREMEHEEETQNYFIIERAYGSFTRSFTLPQGADTEHCRAELKDGVLTVVLPKRPEMQPRRIGLGGGQGENAPKA